MKEDQRYAQWELQERQRVTKHEIEEKQRVMLHEQEQSELVSAFEKAEGDLVNMEIEAAERVRVCLHLFKLHQEVLKSTEEIYIKSLPEDMLNPELDIEKRIENLKKAEEIFSKRIRDEEIKVGYFF